MDRRKSYPRYASGSGCRHENYAEVTAKVTGKDNQNAAGAGAAGGLGFAFLNYLDGELTPGIQLILDAVHIEDEMKDADVVVTGKAVWIIRLPWGKPRLVLQRLVRNMAQKLLHLQEVLRKRRLPAMKQE